MSPSPPALYKLVRAAVFAAAGVLTVVADRAAAQQAERSPSPVVDAQRQGNDAAERRAQRLRGVRNWGYWLSSIDVGGVAVAPHDLMVVDNGVSANRRFIRHRSPEEVARMKRRPDGSARVLLAYLSLGEAERYRAYWRPEWYERAKKPAWLGERNPDWDGNFYVRFWYPEWQALILGAPESYLDVIMAQGFDGVFLDRADAFASWETTRPTAPADMAAFLRRIADYAHKRNPDFLVVMQNAEELLDNPLVLDGIDGIAKEDLFYGMERPEAPNPADDVAYSLKQLRMARDLGRKVFVVEYLSDTAKMTTVAKQIATEGFLPYFAPRLLNCLNPPVTLPPDSGFVRSSCH